MKMLKPLAAALAVCAAVAVQARQLEDIQKSGTIILASEGQYAPFNFFKGTTLTGFEVEVAELVAKKMGLKVQWKTIGFDALLTGLKQDRWDLVIASHAITDERSKAVTALTPVCALWTHSLTLCYGLDGLATLHDGATAQAPVIAEIRL